MSQSEPYQVLKLSPTGVERGRTFATKAAAKKFAKAHGYNVVAQKRKGHAGMSIVERL